MDDGRLRAVLTAVDRGMSDAGRMGITQQFFKQGALTQDFIGRVTFMLPSLSAKQTFLSRLS